MLFSAASYGGKYENDLLSQKIALEATLSKYSDLGMYTPSEFEMELGFIDKLFSKDEMTKAVEELNNVGFTFLAYLEDNDSAYQQISIDEWLRVVGILLSIDDLVSKKLAWGNLVIKIAICNKIFYWMFDYVDTHRGMIEDEMLDDFLLIQKELRSHYPSNTSMLYIAMRHYGKEIDFDISDYLLRTSYHDDQRTFQRILDLYFNDIADGREQAEQYLANEGKETIGSFVDLYEKPIPLLVSFTADYFQISWQYYEYFALVLRNPKILSSKNLTKDVVYNFLVDEYNGEGRFWMPQNAISFAIKPDVYSKNYMNAVTNELFLDRVRRDRESARQRNRRKANKLFSTGLLW
ncbi:MAG: hypothetical protein P8179_24000 [Candidatus Thiodiazotropha sp.]